MKVEPYKEFPNRDSGTLSLREYLLVFTFALLIVKLFQQWGIFWKRGNKEDDYNAYKSLPGPRSFFLIGNILLWKNDLLNFFVNLGIKYGDVFKMTFFNKSFVFLNSPEAAQKLLLSRNWGHMPKSKLLERIWPEKLEALLTYPGGEKWKARRKMLKRPFLHGSLKRYNTSFHKHSERLVRRLEERFTGAIDVADDLLRHCIFGISSEILMGVDMEGTTVDGANFSADVDLFLKKLFVRAYRPWLLIPWIWNRSSAKRECDQVLDRMLKATLIIIQKSWEKIKLQPGTEEEQSDTMIDVMLRHGVEEKLIFFEVAVTLGAANETTPYVVEYVLFMLALHQEHQEACRQEIHEVYADPSNIQNGVLNFDALKQLKYLERCIQEALRIHPIAAIIRTVETPLRINEKLLIPKGVTVVVAPYMLQNHPKYYPNPTKFDPDRFLPENVRERHHHLFIPFSGGARICIGMQLAMIEMKVILAGILRNFEVRTPDSVETLQFVLDPTVKSTKPIRFCFKKRR